MKLTHLLLVPALVFAAADTPLEVAPAQAQVQFTLGDVLHTVHGTFNLKRGHLRFDPETGKASGEIVVDAASGNSGSSARDHRMNANILESDRYPEISYRPDQIVGKIAPEGPSDATLHGIFNIHGADHELAVPVHIDASGGRYTAVAHFSVPYVKWGMKNPSTFILRVNDHVEIDVKLVAEPARATASAAL